MAHENNEQKLEETTGSLPPRSTVHKKKVKMSKKNQIKHETEEKEQHEEQSERKRIKIKYPIIRLLALFFILLPIAILSYTFHNKNNQNEPISSNADKSSFESVDYENNETIDNEKRQQGELNSSGDETRESQYEDQRPEDQTTSKDDTKLVNEKTIVEQEEEPNQNPEKSKKTNPEPQYEIKYHTVKADETIFRISIKYYNSREGEQLIREWNDLSDNNIYEGQRLKIPIKVTQKK